MIKYNGVAVSALFDSGDFMSTFKVICNTKSLHSFDMNIQQVYDLSYDDFNVLSILIADVVSKYLKEKK